jgi:neutral ceramidase
VIGWSATVSRRLLVFGSLLAPIVFTIAILVASAPPPAVAVQSPPLDIGLAEADITPPIGYRLDGYFTERLSTGVKDPLKAKALVFRQGNTRAVLVVCDVIGVPQSLTTEVRALAAARTGIPAANIAITATHTHTGPLFSGERARIFSEQAAAKYGTDPLAAVNYPEMLRDRLVEVIAAAAANVAPASLEFVSATEDRVSFNRRYHLKDGSVVTNPGIANPNVVRAAGPVDHDLPFILISRDKRPVGSLAVFAMHLDTVGGTEYSADYAGRLATALGREFGETFISVFGTGTCGDINHIDVSGRRKNDARLIGEQLGVSILAARPRQALTSPSLAAASARLTLPLRIVSDAQIASARANAAKIGSNELPFLKQVETVTTLDLARRGARLDTEVQVFRIDAQTAIVLLPGEIFADLGLAIKRASPFMHTLVIELSNDNPAYIPTETAFKEGSYETVNSRIAPGGGERLVTEAVRLLKTLALP